jgi:hypothetical protein
MRLLGGHLPDPDRKGFHPVSAPYARALLRVTDPSSRSLACLIGFLAPTLWCASWVPWLRAIPIVVMYLIVVVAIRLIASPKRAPRTA